MIRMILLMLHISRRFACICFSASRCRFFTSSDFIAKTDAVEAPISEIATADFTMTLHYKCLTPIRSNEVRRSGGCFMQRANFCDDIADFRLALIDGHSAE